MIRLGISGTLKRRMYRRIVEFKSRRIEDEEEEVYAPVTQTPVSSCLRGSSTCVSPAWEMGSVPFLRRHEGIQCVLVLA